MSGVRRILKEHYFSEFQKERQKTNPILPKVYQMKGKTELKHSPVTIDSHIQTLFPTLAKESPGYSEVVISEGSNALKELRIGVVLSGGQAPGGHNVISGVYDYVKQRSEDGKVFGFLDGPIGIYTNSFLEIDEEFMNSYRNQGGFDMICAGRHKIETEQQMKDSKTYCEGLKLDGLIVIGGDDSNTNACVLAEYFKANNSSVKVIGAPKTIDGDLKNEYIEVSFGYDTATKVYTEEIGNICVEVNTTKKDYHFIRLMGRSASHIALECELQTLSNFTIIGEEVAQLNHKLSQIVTEIVEMIIKRSEMGFEFGVVLVPEGLIEFIPEMGVLIAEINEILASYTGDEVEKYVLERLTKDSKELFNFIPSAIRSQLLLDRDPHGNVQVAKIETERLLIMLVTTELEKKTKEGKFKGHFSPKAHYFGYEGRCALPTLFDTNYCYGIGYNAACLINMGATGCMSILKGLHLQPEEWTPAGCPLMAMMNIERRKGKDVPVIKKCLVDLQGKMFKEYSKIREAVKLSNNYLLTGPIQFSGPTKYSPPFLVRCADFDPEKIKTRNKESISEITKHLISLKPSYPKAISQKHKIIPTGITKIVNWKSDKFVPNMMKDEGYLRGAEFVDMEHEGEALKLKDIKRIGVIFCGYLSPGGNNAISGILKYQEEHKEIEVIGFLKGVQGLYDKKYITIKREDYELYQNLSGYDYLDRSYETISDKVKALENCKELNLGGLILIGGDYTLSNALYLSEYFIEKGSSTSIICVPAGISSLYDRNLMEISLGFDSTNRLYSQLIGNIMTDSASATKYWYFLNLMEGKASHHVLSCALECHPNMVIIGEEYKSEGACLKDVVKDVADLVQERANIKKNFGTLLISQGLFLQLPETRHLINELDHIYQLNNNKFNVAELGKQLSPESFAIYNNLPSFAQEQLLSVRDETGHFIINKLETERIIIELVTEKIKERKNEGKFKGAFSPIGHFFGYQGRSSLPTLFDNDLGATYGFLAAGLIHVGLTGLCVNCRGLHKSVENWKCEAIPLISLATVKKSYFNPPELNIKPADINVLSDEYIDFKYQRREWRNEDHYTNPGPIQFSNNGRSLRGSLLFKRISKTLNSEMNISEYTKEILKISKTEKDQTKLKSAEMILLTVLTMLQDKN